MDKLDPKGLEAMTATRSGPGPLSLLGDREWQNLCEKDDRTSPEECPDMLLITRAELGAAMSEAFLLAKDQDRVAYLAHAERAGAGAGWRTIDSAPKDGTAFLAYSPMHGIRANVSWGRFNRFDPDGYSDLMSNWTHWMPAIPLPAPPGATPPSPPLDAAAVRESALREGIDALPRYDGNGGAKLGESVIVPAANGRYVALDDVRALIAPAAPDEGEGRDHG